MIFFLDNSSVKFQLNLHYAFNLEKHIWNFFSPFFPANMAQTRRYKRTWRKGSFCEYCCERGNRYNHAYSERCHRSCRHCKNCGKWGHTMLFCNKLKNCDLCGKSGHNPIRCWKYCTISEWMLRAEELGRCGECLTLFTTGEEECTNCCSRRVYWKPYNCVDVHGKESQTEENSKIIQECQTELQEGETMIEELKNKILSLENKLESSNATIDDLNWKLQCIKKEKERELHKVNELDLLCKQKEMELKKLWEKIAQKDTELEQHRKRSAQPSQTAPAAAQQHCPASAQQPYPASDSSNLRHLNETNCIRPTLVDLQDQQQKLCVMVNQLYNKVMTPNMSWLNYSNFNPNMGLYDTGQYFR